VGRSGRVFAVDTNKKFLEYIRSNAGRRGLENVETVLVAEERLDLPKKSLDLIFMRNVCHHLQGRVEYFRRLRYFLKPDGGVAIIERSKPSTLHSIFGHYVPRETIIGEMEEAGFTVKEEFSFLLNQFFIIFTQQVHS
jgi:arsenite methyltransferase